MTSELKMNLSVRYLSQDSWLDQSLSAWETITWYVLLIRKKYFGTDFWIFFCTQIFSFVLKFHCSHIPKCDNIDNIDFTFIAFLKLILYSYPHILTKIQLFVNNFLQRGNNHNWAWSNYFAFCTDLMLTSFYI